MGEIVGEDPEHIGSDGHEVSEHVRDQEQHRTSDAIHGARVSEQCVGRAGRRPYATPGQPLNTPICFGTTWVE
jgi:hypothetical protein